MSKILVLAEQQFGQLTNATLHAVTAARELANKVGGGYTIAVAGSGIDAVAQKLAGYGADAVLQFEHPALENYTAQAYAQARSLLDATAYKINCPAIQYSHLVTHFSNSRLIYYTLYSRSWYHKQASH